MGEVGPQVAAPIPVHHPMRKKRELYSQPHWIVSSQLPREDDWHINKWKWDSQRFEAIELQGETLQLGGNNNNGGLSYKGEERGLDLNLPSGFNDLEDTPVDLTRPSKKVRSGSTGSGGGGGGGNYPKCQVDNCKEDLSIAKDYHRRHKVCEVHSKATKALVGKQMQRFCQQCSRFHLLSEFDEGKRSCRRRLDGHNRRRRKTLPDVITSQVVALENRDNTSNNANMDVMALLTALVCAQGKNEAITNGSPGVPQREQLLQILNKIKALPLPMDLASKLNNIGILARENPDQPSAMNPQNSMNGASSPSTMDLLAALSATLGSSAPEAIAFLSQGGFGNKENNDSTKLTSSDHGVTTNVEKRTLEFPSFGRGERTSSSKHSPSQDSDSRGQDTRSSLSLQLFTSSPEDESQPTVASSTKYYSSASSNPVEDRSPSSSPVVQELFPLHTSPGTRRSNNYKNTSPIPRTSCLPLELFGASNRGATANPNSNVSRHQSGYASSGSDYSPPSLNSDAQDRTGKIIFKLFEKDPSQLPGTLRTELEENLLQRVSSLVQDSDFWRNTRFLVNTGRQLASHKHGRIRLSKSWRTLNSPELITVSPLAVVAGEETALIVRGRNLTNDGIRLRCAHMGNYTSIEVTGTEHRRTKFDELNVSSFKVQSASPVSLGRCFIEVENGFRGDNFPLIIANATICKELNCLEDEFHPKDVIEEQTQNLDRPRSREEVICFLNELGWLFQRKWTSDIHGESDFSLPRFKFLLVCSVERDCCSLIRTVLDMMVERNLGKDGLMNKESLDMLAETQLLNRAVKRRNTKMAETLIHYSVNPSTKNFIFLPNIAGPGDITPLHLAASTSGSDDMIDVLTNDPQEIGLSCWNTLVDASGQTPFRYAAMRNNHSYNTLVTRKLADKRNGQISLNIENGIDQIGLSKRLSSELKRSCNTCASVALKYQKKVSSSRRLFPTPIIHSMLAVATVCVCVCVFMHAFPIVRQGSHFSWGGLDYGSI
ncbi:squamosa promoter-binding-like protein 16 isoform X2 [Arabidopsis lyrata subsp. lyrata]|uniref:squamosa promoter-binding-like protein 16 isoform X2 n=1 Tax=Arabidopsis lyrata subsp. lyrata TaxID=81972 RepID=UPI000A29BDE8|nr:squamosa promoter-binding-like protein 16 isoform X2 [Arabidopsis lyrata subsp. lyrata]|eukprot:XP_020890348.1 squamosa promoter-binding-like protein 16 isoform X2 [Arabidopsis lyrata subsp. lyrata]